MIAVAFGVESALAEALTFHRRQPARRFLGSASFVVRHSAPPAEPR